MPVDRPEKELIQRRRQILRELRILTGMSVAALDEAAHRAEPEWPGRLAIYLQENRPLPRIAARALDTVFALELSGLNYPAGAIARSCANQTVEELQTFLNQVPTTDANEEEVAPPAPAPMDTISSSPATTRRRWVLPVAATVAIAAAAAGGMYATQYGVTELDGSVHCQSGAAVNQVYVYWGGWFHTGTWAQTRMNPADRSTASFTADVPVVRPHELHVGCGANASGGWAVVSTTTPSDASTMNVVCDDTSTGPASKPPFLGRCS